MAKYKDYQIKMPYFTNPHLARSSSLITLFESLFKNRQLILQMIRREVIGRYKGSIFGILWSFLNPILMLVIYSFVFSVIFKARWGNGDSESQSEFALILFSGIIIFNLFSEAINRAPGLILGNVNYVKKVIFPLEILPVVSLGAALFHSLVSLCVLLLGLLIFNGSLSVYILYFPIVLIPLLLFTLGVSWFLASLGVYMRDIGQVIGILTTVLMFLSPIFYPISALPEKYQKIILLNPLSFIIEQGRNLFIYGHAPDFIGLFFYAIGSMAVLWIGYAWFQKTRKGFADVL